MSTPSEGQGPDAFRQPMPGQRPDDENAFGQPSSHPAPPPMASPYGAPLSNNESNTGGSAQRQSLRFPTPQGPAPQGPSPQGTPVWGSEQAPPPFVAPPTAPGTGATIPPAAPTGSGWGNRNETFFLPPQYSYNPDQQQPVAPAPQPPKRSRKRLVLALSGAAVVIAAAVTGGVILTSGGSSDKPGPSGSQMGADARTSSTASSKIDGLTPAWSVNGDALDASAKTTVGSWLVDDHTVVRGDATGLQAYEAETGKALWTYAVPDQGSVICDMSPPVHKKVGVVRYGPKGTCTNVAAVDTDSGKALWTAQIPGGTTTPGITATDDLVAASAGNVLTVWNASDGKKLWDVDLSKATPACRLIQAGLQGASAAVLADCKGPTVLMKDALTGTDQWQAKLPPDANPNTHHTLVMAAAPTIVHIEAAPSGLVLVDRYYSISDKGQIQATIDGFGPFGQLEPRIGPTGLQHQYPHVAGNILVEPTGATDPTSGNAPAAGLVAFDLTTGKQLWQAPPMTGAPVTIAGQNQDTTIVFDGGSTKSGPGARLLAFSTATGAPATSPIKDPLGPDWAGPAAAYVVGDRVVVVPSRPRKGAAVVGFAVK